MALLDIYSKRRKRLKAKLPDVYQYDKLPEPFRVKVVHILSDVFLEAWGQVYTKLNSARPKIPHIRNFERSWPS
ncbi:MAG: hypothetical protein OXI05_04900, partial [Bacteroidota bacterium]|nr:hypothetical protein [Bacteroidota bacterium]